MTQIALLGAGGKMGLRLTANLAKSDYSVRHVEISESGRAALAERGVTALPLEQALEGADVVIMGVPDNLIGMIAHQIVRGLKPGCMVLMLDAAAPYAGVLPDRADLTYFVTHPCHPPVIHDEVTPEAQMDFFGGIHAKQHIVCALMQGPEEHYALGEAVARTIFAPVDRAHRCTVEQMAILEPVLSETVGATCMQIIREATDEAVNRGVPRQAALDFILGHLKVEIGIVFDMFPGAKFSDGALKAIDRAKEDIFQPDWRKVFEPEAVKRSIDEIAQPPAKRSASS
jgi:D-apionate oxidoisomerase